MTFNTTVAAEKTKVTAVYGLLTMGPAVLTGSWRVTLRCHLAGRGKVGKQRGARDLTRSAAAVHVGLGRDSVPRLRPPRARFAPGPHSPIGRGSGLKIRPVSVRVRLGARAMGPMSPMGPMGEVDYPSCPPVVEGSAADCLPARDLGEVHASEVSTSACMRVRWLSQTGPYADQP